MENNLSYWTKRATGAIRKVVPNHTVATWEVSQVLNPHPLRQGGYSMDTVNLPNRWTRLIQRRTEITMTLRHVELEQMNIEAKEASMDREARAARLNLLRDLNDWYAREINQVDQALTRVDQNNPGVCIACRAPISVETLEVFPEAEFCADCENFQREL